MASYNDSFMQPAGSRDRYVVPMKPSVQQGFFEDAVTYRQEQMQRLYEQVMHALGTVAVTDATTGVGAVTDTVVDTYEPEAVQQSTEVDDAAVYALYDDAEEALTDDSDDVDDAGGVDVDDFDIEDDIPDVMVVDVDEDMF